MSDALSGLPLEVEVRSDSEQVDLNDNANSASYRDRDAIVGGTDSPWAQAAPFPLWRQAADFQEGDIVDGRAGRLKFSGTLSQSDLAG